MKLSINNTSKKVPVECYSRVVGYFRPVNQWNAGKQDEYIQRKVADMKELKKQFFNKDIGNEY